MTIKFCTVAPNVCGASLWNLLCITILAPRILRCLLDFWKICAPLLYVFGKLLVHGSAHGTRWMMDWVKEMLYQLRGECNLEQNFKTCFQCLNIVRSPLNCPHKCGVDSLLP